jgi:putative DNA primase/helicase
LDKVFAKNFERGRDLMAIYRNNKKLGFLEYKDESEENAAWNKISSELVVYALTRDATGDNWGKVLKFKDPDGTEKTYIMNSGMLATDGTELRRELMLMGLVIEPGTFPRRHLLSYLSSEAPKKRIRCVNRIGWNNYDGHFTFLFPNRRIGGEDIVFQSQVSAKHSFMTSGSTRDWNEAMCPLIKGNTRSVFSVCLALAPVLLEMSSIENGGFNMVGGSSTGKSTTLFVAGSIWGGGGISGFVKSWRSTSNGLESVAKMHCDSFLALDELGQAEPRTVSEAAYMLANGAGKSRSLKDGNLRDSAEWRLLFLSTGEIGIIDKINEDTRLRSFAGQEVRIVDIPAVPQGCTGVFESLNDCRSGAELSVKMKEAALKNYGSPAIDFISLVQSEYLNIKQKIGNEIERITAKLVPLNSNGQVVRIANRFALAEYAGRLASRNNILDIY